MITSKTVQQLPAEWVTPENFHPYGQVISASVDGKFYDAEDAQLNLQNGLPRFYIMRLQDKGRKFHTITRHVKCTQCLGSLSGKDWLIAVAPPNNDIDKPRLEDITAFRIPGNCFIKLEVADTNVVDHFTHNFLTSHRLEFEII